MPITKTGKKSYEINLSEATKKILRDEQEQLTKNKNIIFEREFHPDWIERTCSRCFMTYMKKEGDVFKCPKCGLIKIPKAIIPKINKNIQMIKFLQEKIKVHEKVRSQLIKPLDIKINEDYIKKLQEELSKYT